MTLLVYVFDLMSVNNFYFFFNFKCMHKTIMKKATWTQECLSVRFFSSRPTIPWNEIFIIIILIFTSAQLFLLHNVICRLHVSTNKWSSSGLPSRVPQDVFRVRYCDNTRIPARQQKTLDTLWLHCKYNLTTLEYLDGKGTHIFK